ncbi:MAG: hypothetical protein E3J35_10660 [Methanomassiliicoccales archaeon]|nr:MAG: hypothetical protein E3J35_10660 [Methanomassiliicoccales archaeon]
MNLRDWFEGRWDRKYALIIGIVVVTIEIAYWGAAVGVHSRLGQCDCWPDGCAGSFFPVPYRGEGDCTMAVVPMSPLDGFVCSMVQYWIFIPAAILETILFSWVGWILGKRRMRKEEDIEKSEAQLNPPTDVK